MGAAAADGPPSDKRIHAAHRSTFGCGHWLPVNQRKDEEDHDAILANPEAVKKDMYPYA